jgi:ATP-dependent helicase/nuclease subunit A
MLGEELRLLYVALTRARDTLVLTGTVAQKKLEEVWPMLEQVSSAKVAVAKSYLDWLACWIYGSAGFQIDAETGSNKWLKWSLYEENDPRLTDISSDAVTENFSDTNEKMKTNPKTLEALRSRLEFVYPRINATKILAKTTVTQLRKQLADEPDAAPLHFKSDRSPSGNPARLTAKMTKGARMLNAAELGTLHHKYLSSVDLSKTGSMAELEAEAVRLVKESTLTNGDAAQLNLRAILGFWDSDLGKRIASESKNVRRELAFTSRFAANDLGNLSATNLDDDFVVVQGIADLVVIRANEIWLVDYKTDMVGAENLEERIRAYAPQVQLYAKALSNIYKRPVTEAWLYFLESGKAESVKP